MATVCNGFVIRIYPAQGSLRPHLTEGGRIIRDAGLAGDIVRYAARASARDFPFTMEEHPGLIIGHSEYGTHCVINNQHPTDEQVQRVISELDVWNIAMSLELIETDSEPEHPEGLVGLVSSLETLPKAGRYSPDSTKPSVFGTVYDYSGSHGLYVPEGKAQVRSWSPCPETATQVVAQLAGITI